MIESSLNYSNTIFGTTAFFLYFVGYLLFRSAPWASLGAYLPGPDFFWPKSYDSISSAAKHYFLFSYPGLGRGKSYLI